MSRKPAGSGRRPGPGLRRVCDVVAAFTVVPLLVTAWYVTRAAWRVYHPRPRRRRQSPEDFGLTAERLRIPSADGLLLAAWWIPAPTDGPLTDGPSPTVVLGHGMGADSGKMLPLAATLHQAGYHVLTFDMRNHGDSGRDNRLRGMSPRYSEDFHAVVRYLWDRPECGPGSVACLGVSMSAWTALEAARLEPQLVRSVICDSGPQLDIAAALRRSYEAGRPRLPWLLSGPLMFRFGRWVFSLASRFFLRPAPWPQELGDHSIRLLFITGDADPICRPSDLAAQVAWYPEARTWIVPRAGHTQSSIVAADEYVAHVLETLTAAFGDRDPAAAGPADSSRP
jgi:uncharacterized protein